MLSRLFAKKRLKPEKTSTTKMKGLRIVADFDRDSRKGIAARSLSELQDKVRFKWQSQFAKSKIHLFLADGTEIDEEDYFESLGDQTVLIASTKDCLSIVKENQLDKFLAAARRHGRTEELLEKIHNLILDDSNDEDKEAKWSRMASFVKDQSKQNKAHLSSRKDDPDWFKDLSTNANTKEEYMIKGCQARIRGYLAKAEAGLKNEDNIQKVLTEFRSLLKADNYNGHYFDRKSDKTDKYCQKDGLFVCEGRFDENLCKYSVKTKSKTKSPDLIHEINPYESSEARIMFSTWNLDHVIERSRTIVPTMIKAVQGCPKNKEVNVSYFYKLLFTRDNLKLVHIVCHDKQEHSSKKCNLKSIYCSSSAAKKSSAISKINHRKRIST